MQEFGIIIKYVNPTWPFYFEDITSSVTFYGTPVHIAKSARVLVLSLQVPTS